MCCCTSGSINTNSIKKKANMSHKIFRYFSEFIVQVKDNEGKTAIERFEGMCFERPPSQILFLVSKCYQDHTSN